MESLNNDEEMCWFSSNAPEGSEDTLKSGLKISGQNAGSSKDFSEHHEGLKSNHEGHSMNGSNKKNVSVGNKIRTDSDDPVAIGHASFLNVHTKSESRDILMPKEQVNNFFNAFKVLFCLFIFVGKRNIPSSNGKRLFCFMIIFILYY